MATLEEAILLAAQAHLGQKDKCGYAYILHPLRVMMKMDSDEEKIVAILHDVIEDTGHTLEDLRQAGYSKKIVTAIDCLTRREDESYEEFVARAAKNQIARKVKLADIEDNMDIRRLQTIKAKDVERLKKYRKAWEVLK